MDSLPAPRRFPDIDINALYYFVLESNRIEGIKETSEREYLALCDLLDHERVTVPNLCGYVYEIANGALLRGTKGMPQVWVGDHEPEPAGIKLTAKLERLLDDVAALKDPWSTHVAYETLHPFMDGNGRSGRALWLWMMLRIEKDLWFLRRGFLHQFYYQTLSGVRRNAAG